MATILPNLQLKHSLYTFHGSLIIVLYRLWIMDSTVTTVPKVNVTFTTCLICLCCHHCTEGQCFHHCTVGKCYFLCCHHDTTWVSTLSPLPPLSLLLRLGPFPGADERKEKKRIKSTNEQTLISNKIRKVLAISVVVLLQTIYPTIHDTLHCTNIKKHIQHINTNENIIS